MLCVAKNRKCEYSVVSRPRRRATSVASGGLKSRNDDNNIVVNQHKQSNQAGIIKRRSRVQTTRQSSPLSTSSSSPESQVRVAPDSQPSLQDSSIAIAGSDTGAEDAPQRLFSSDTPFPDSLEQVPAVFPQLDPAAGDFFGNVAGPTPMAVAKLGAGLDASGSAETPTARGDRGKHDDNKSLHTSPSTNSLFELGVDQMDFLIDNSYIPTTTMAPSAHDNTVTTEAQPATHFSTLPDFDATSTFASSSCCCMMTAVSIYEALQDQLVWGDPVAGPSPAPSPKSASTDSPYSSASGSSWSGSGSGFGVDMGSGSEIYQTTPLMTQQTILQRQKTLLVRFESLRCGTCWSRSDFVILIITMCDRMLTSLEAVERFVCSKTDNTNGVISNINAAADVNAMATSHAELDLPLLSRSRQFLQPGLNAWQIDDDDEQELVISLIKSRVTRLGNLIAMAEGTGSANAWLWHERLAQALRKRSTKLLISLSFRDFP